MEDGDIVFGRNMHGHRDDDTGELDPENDVILFWCCDGYVSSAFGVVIINNTVCTAVVS